MVNGPSPQEMYDNRFIPSYILEPFPEFRHFSIRQGYPSGRGRRVYEKDADGLIREARTLFNILHSKGIGHQMLVSLVDEVYAPSKIVVHHRGCVDIPGFDNARIRFTPMESEAMCPDIMRLMPASFALS